MVYTKEYCSRANEHDFLSIEAIQLNRWTAVIANKINQDNAARKNTGSVDYRVRLSGDRVADAVQRTLADLHMIVLRQNPQNPSSYKIAGLFAKHVMDVLPFRIEGPGAVEERHVNAVYSLLVAVALTHVDQNSFGGIDFHLFRQTHAATNGDPDPQSMIDRFCYILSNRSANGELLELLFSSMDIGTNLYKANRPPVEKK